MTLAGLAAVLVAMVMVNGCGESGSGGSTSSSSGSSGSSSKGDDDDNDDDDDDDDKSSGSSGSASSGSSGSSSASGSESVAFADIKPILAAKCAQGGCHDGAIEPNYAKIKEADWETSDRNRVKSGTMPPKSAKKSLTAGEKQKILDYAPK